MKLVAIHCQDQTGERTKKVRLFQKVRVACLAFVFPVFWLVFWQLPLHAASALTEKVVSSRSTNTTSTSSTKTLRKIEKAPKKLPNKDVKLVVQKNSIRSLRWSRQKYRLKHTGKGESLKAHVTVEGRLKRDDWTLTWKNKKIRRTSDGKFKFKVPIDKVKSRVNLVAIGPRGEVQKQKVSLVYKDWPLFYAAMTEEQKTEVAETTEEAEEEAPSEKVFFSLGAGYSFINYSEDRANNDFTQQAITGKAAVTYPLSYPRWDLGFSTYLTLAPTSSSSAKSARFFGLNARIGYNAPFVKTPWRLSILFGTYYVTMLVSEQNLGFKNVGGPQLFPKISRTFNNGDSAYMYFKFSPISDRFTVLSLQNREIAAGGGYIFPLKNGKSVAVTLDVALLKLFIQNVNISTNSISLGAGYGF